MPRNLYISLDDLKQRLRISAPSAARDSELLAVIESASREIDGFCKRMFHSESATRFFDTGLRSDELLIDDLLSVSAFTVDSEHDGTYDGETWVEGTDFYLGPDNSFPRMWVNTTGFGNFSFPRRDRRHVKIVGIFGHGDGESATPWKDVPTLTFSVADTIGLTFTVSADPTSAIEVGQTLLIESEQVGVVTAASAGPDVITVDGRGVNGTTAVAHASKAASVALYPPAVVKTARQMAIADENVRNSTGFASSEADGKGFTTNLIIHPQILLKRSLGPLMKVVI